MGRPHLRASLREDHLSRPFHHRARNLLHHPRFWAAASAQRRMERSRHRCPFHHHRQYRPRGHMPRHHRQGHADELRRRYVELGAHRRESRHQEDLHLRPVQCYRPSARDDRAHRRHPGRRQAGGRHQVPRPVRGRLLRQLQLRPELGRDNPRRREQVRVHPWLRRHHVHFTALLRHHLARSHVPGTHEHGFHRDRRIRSRLRLRPPCPGTAVRMPSLV